MFFTQTLSALVVNAKLDRPLDSHAPQTEHRIATLGRFKPFSEFLL
jgi:hypothetical protein